MPQCAHCGAVHVSEADYCPQCGAPVAGAAERPAGGLPGVRYAGFWRRVAASLVDTLVLFVPIALLEAALGGSGIETHDAIDAAGRTTGTKTTVDWAHFAIYQVASLLIWWFYFAIQESSVRQATIGKRALSIAVTDLRGNRLSFGRATGRLFAKVLSGLILGVGYLMVAFTKRKQALHDKVADTLVVVRPRA